MNSRSNSELLDSDQDKAFLELLLFLEGDSGVSPELFSFLFELLNEHIRGGGKVDYFQTFFAILFRAPIQTQIEQLRKFNHLVRIGGLRLQADLCKEGWILHILDLFARPLPSSIIEELGRLLQLLCCCSISVVEMRALLNLVLQSSEKQPKHFSLLLNILQSCSMHRGPRCFFDYSGKDSGLELPRYHIPSSGYAFCAWIRFETLLDPLGKDPTYCPYILALQNDDMCGLEVFIHQNFLAVRSTVGRNKFEYQVFRQFKLSTRSWHMLGLSHTFHFLRRSELSLFLDGNLVQTLPLLYPRIDKVVSCRIGVNNAGSRHPSLVVQIPSPNSQPLSGQMSTVMLLQESLDEEEMHHVLSLGPCGFYGSDSSRISSIAFPKRTVKVLFCYDPKATSDSLCYELSSGLPSFSAILLPGTSVVHVSPFPIALWQAGGIQLLLPMFRQLESSSDVPEKSKSPPASPAPARFLPISSPAPSQLETLLLLLKELITRERRHLNDIAASHFFSHMGTVLAGKPLIWTKSAVETLGDLASALSDRGNLFLEFFSEIYMNPPVWIHSLAENQVQILKQALAFVQEYPERYRTPQSVQRVLDLMRSYFWFVPDDFSLAFNQDRPTQFRPTSGEIRSLRGILATIIAKLTRGQPTYEETLAIVQFIQECGDDEQRLDVVQFVLSLVSGPNCTLWPHMFKLGGLVPWLSCLKTTNGKLFFYSLKLVAYMLRATKAIYSPSVTTTRHFQTLKHVLQSRPFESITYNVLMELLFDMLTPYENQPPTIRGKELTFVHVEVLPVVFELLCLSGSSTLQIEGVNCIHAALSQSAKNRELFLAQPLWQSWILGLLASADASGRAGEADSRDCLGDVELGNIVVRMLVTLFGHCLWIKEGSHIMKDTMALMIHFSNMGYCDARGLGLSLHHALLAEFLQNQAIFDSLHTNPVLRSTLFWWLENVAILLFWPKDEESDLTAMASHHFVMNLRRQRDGTWEDFGFTQKFLNFLGQVEAMDAAVLSDQGVRLDLEFLSALRLRLILVSIFETDRYLCRNSQKLELSIEKRFFPGLSDRGKQALSRYLQLKMKEWNGEMNTADAVLGTNVQRLKHHIEKMLIPQKLSRGDIMKILSVLFKAIKEAFDQKGRGVESIHLLFQHVVSISRELLNIDVLSGLSNEQLARLFMAHFYHEECSELRHLDEDMNQAIIEEEKLFLRRRVELDECRESLTVRIGEIMEQEKSLQNSMEKEILKLWREMQEKERGRLDTLLIDNRRVLREKERAWKGLLESLWPQKTEHWQLGDLENCQRMRKLMCPNSRFDPHRDKVPATHQELGQIHHHDRVPAIPVAKNISSSEEEKPESQEAEEESNSSAEVPLSLDAKVDMQLECELVQPMKAIAGELNISAHFVHFTNEKEIRELKLNAVGKKIALVEQYWLTSDLAAIYPRRFLLKDKAMELFFVDHSTCFLHFHTTGERNRVFRKIVSLQPPSLSDSFISLLGRPPSPAQILKRRKLTDLWVHRKISNFDYLMSLNTISGRSYNDLSQYPVFPWILSDYTSETLNLSDPRVFRDLSKPMGAQSQERLEEAIARYESLGDQDIPKFHYGTHYSTMAAVLHYLVRMEPFTSHFLDFQGGKFDHPNRMFTSLEMSWKGTFIDGSCVKELIPEFFYLPEMLLNSNRFNFGLPFGSPAPVDETGLVGEGVGDVILPPWARGSTDAFVRLHASALESEYVSAHLNEWIDLIFGYKQRGPDAVQAHNVFFYLTYEGMVDVDAIEDPVQRESVCSQIQNFGQTPSQLFNKPHPRRLLLSEVEIPVAVSQVEGPVFSPDSYSLQIPGSAPLDSVLVLPAPWCKIITIGKDGILGKSTYSLVPDGKVLPFTLDIDRSIEQPNKRKTMEMTDAPGTRSTNCAVSDPEGRFLFTGGDWTGSICMRSTNGRLVRRVGSTTGVVECIHMEHCFLVAGCSDTTISVYDLSTVSKSWKHLANIRPGSPKDPLQTPLHIIRAHTNGVRKIAVSEDYDIIVSASSGRCCIHRLRQGSLVRYLDVPSPLDHLVISRTGDIVSYCGRTKQLMVHTLNGRPLAVKAVEVVGILITSVSGDYVLTAELSSGLRVRSVSRDLEIVHEYEVRRGITALSMMEDRFIIAALEDGSLVFYPFTPEAWTEKRFLS